MKSQSIELSFMNKSNNSSDGIIQLHSTPPLGFSGSLSRT